MKRKILSAEDLFEGILKNDKVSLSQAITLIESSAAEDIEKANKLVDMCLPHSGKSTRLGITGVPGVGKSTFIETLGSTIVSENSLAVLAIDPTSKRTRGSILGDKTRMNKLAIHPKAFIRPSPAGKSLGGVAYKTREVMLLCEAAGYEYIIIETVGVGQSETSVYEMTDLFLLMMLSGAGDELQGIKKGILEMADLIVINKSDGDNLVKTKITKAQLEQVLHLFPSGDSGIEREVKLCSALKNTGIDEVWEAILSYIKSSKSSGALLQRRKKQQVYWLFEYIDRSLSTTFYNRPDVKKTLGTIISKVEKGEFSPQKGAQLLLKGN